MTSQEIPPRDENGEIIVDDIALKDVPVESFKDSQKFESINANTIEDQKVHDAKERMNEETGYKISSKDQDKIKEIQDSFTNPDTTARDQINSIARNRPIGTEAWSAPKTSFENKSYVVGQDQPRANGFKRLTTGIMAMLGFATAATAAEKNPSDSLGNKQKTEKITQIERHEQIGDVTLEGLVSVPMTDTTYDYFFAGFSGNEKDKHKIGKIEQAVKALGMQLGTSEEMSQALKKNGASLVKATGGYGMAINKTLESVDDTKASNVNIKHGGSVTNDYSTFNPTGAMNRYEAQAMEETGFNYNEYPIFVKVKKAPKDQNTANFPGADFAKVK